MKRALDVEGGVGAEGDAVGVDEIEVGGGHGGAKRAVDTGGVGAGDAADDVFDLVGAGEGGDVAGVERKVRKTVEEIVAGTGAEVVGDLVLGAVKLEGNTRAGGAVEGDLGFDWHGDQRQRPN